MTHACTTAGNEIGMWAYCVDCDWMGPVYTPDSPRDGNDLPFWADGLYDIDRHQKEHV